MSTDATAEVRRSNTQTSGSVEPMPSQLIRKTCHSGTERFTLLQINLRCRGALRDAAPDRWGRQLIRRAFSKSGGKRTLSETDYLLGVTDHARIGALRFRPEGEDSFDHHITNFRVPPLIQLPALMNAADAVQTNTETAKDLKLLLNEGSPLGGARPKSSVQDKNGSLAIAKFPKTR